MPPLTMSLRVNHSQHPAVLAPPRRAADFRDRVCESALISQFASGTDRRTETWNAPLAAYLRPKTVDIAHDRANAPLAPATSCTRSLPARPALRVTDEAGAPILGEIAAAMAVVSLARHAGTPLGLLIGDRSQLRLHPPAPARHSAQRLELGRLPFDQG